MYWFLPGGHGDKKGYPGGDSGPGVLGRGDHKSSGTGCPAHTGQGVGGEGDLYPRRSEQGFVRPGQVPSTALGGSGDLRALDSGAEKMAGRIKIRLDYANRPLISLSKTRQPPPKGGCLVLVRAWGLDPPCGAGRLGLRHASGMPPRALGFKPQP